MSQGLGPPRVRAQLRAQFAAEDGETYLARLYERDGLRLRLPGNARVSGASSQAARVSGASRLEALTLNTGGGIVGGDRLDYEFAVLPGANLFLTSQSAEKIYRSQECSAVDVRLTLGQGAHMTYAPQETILFDGAKLRRRLTARLSADASLVVVERLTFGRLAMGERCNAGLVRDAWRIYREDALIFADNFHIEGEIAKILDRPAVGFGARACASVFCAASNAEQKRDAILAHLAPIQDSAAGDAGASAFDNMVFARITHESPSLVHEALGRIVADLHEGFTPRLWW